MISSRATKLLLSIAILLSPSFAFAVPISGDTANSTSGLGNFTGPFNYTAGSATAATITITLTNTSPVANGGFLTAFVFNNPTNLITSVTSFTATDTDFAMLGGPTFDDSVSGAPFGQFDFGVSTGSSFEGGGAPSQGLAVGATSTFTIGVAGSALNTISALTFLSTLSEGTGAGEGYEAFVVRFRGFLDGGSDKVPGDPNDPGQPVPEPATLALLGFGLAGAALRKKVA